MAGVLKLVCTPIGNIRDMTQRGLDALCEADVVLAEDTRTARELFRHLGIGYETKSFLSCNQHNEEHRVEQALELVGDGKQVLLVSDAGAPGISDPGSRMVEAFVKAEAPIEIIPGVSAIVVALMGAGLITSKFAFLGFLPRKGAQRKKYVVDAQKMGCALVIFESALRVEKTLAEIAFLCGSKRVVVARELTKKFETFHRGILGEELNPPFVAKGECVIVVEGGESEVESDPAALEERILEMIEDGELSKKEIAKRLALEFSLSASDVYDQVVQRAKTR